MDELTTEQIESTIEDFTMKLERLRIAYEQYFMGIAKREPSVQLQECVRLMYLLENQQIRNAAMRFRFRTTLQKFNTLRTQWNRTIRQIEAGTYERDVARLKRKMSKDGVAMPGVGRMRSVASVERAVLDAGSAKSAPPSESAPASAVAKPVAAAKAAVPRPTASSPEPAPPPPEPPKIPVAPLPPALASSGFSREDLDSLHRRFVKAKKMCGEDTASVQVDALAESIARQLPKLRSANPGKEIEFQVVIRSGRAILKAVTK